MAMKQEQLTPVQVETILNRSSKILCGFFCPDDMLITLLAEGALKRNDVTRIKKMDTSADKVQALLNKLAESAVSSYESFMSALLEERPDLHARVLEIQKKECGKDVQNVPNPVNPHPIVRPVQTPDEYDEVAPDSDGHYTDRHIQSASPKKEQLNPEDNYNMMSTKKGLAYILNNRHFPNHQKDRDGSEVDFVNMKHLFTEIGYEIVPHENLDAKDILQTMKAFVSKFNDTKSTDPYLSAVVVLMSHGGTGYINGIDDGKVKLKKIEALFEGCLKLKGKPKLFFIQACRGKSITTADEDTEYDDADDDIDLPSNADMYCAYSTAEGYLSLRNNVKGSWFVQAITEVFLSHAHKEDLDSLMHKVSARVTKEKSKKRDGKEEKMVTIRQTPQIVKTGMRKALYFLPKYPSTN